MFYSQKANVQVKGVEDLKRIHRREIKKWIFKFICMFTLSVLFIFLYQINLYFVWGFLSILLLSYLFQVINSIRIISKYPKINDISKDGAGNFSASKIAKLVEDVRIKMNTKCKFDIRIIPDNQCQAFTYKPLYKRFFKNKNILALHFGLLRILSEPELKAVIAHEIGHHLTPSFISNILGEYWADFYACRYYDPVAMANALIKIDQNTFLFNVFIQRCVYLANNLIDEKYINQAFWEYLSKNTPIPFKSKRDANRSAKKLILTYLNQNKIPCAQRNCFSRIVHSLKNKFTGDILNRKKLSKIRYVDWSAFDSRIKDNYLDKYELINLFKVIKNKRMTINRFSFFDIDKTTHPNTNRRLLFIIEKFLLLDDYSYERLFDRAAENKLKI